MEDLQSQIDDSLQKEISLKNQILEGFSKYDEDIQNIQETIHNLNTILTNIDNNKASNSPEKIISQNNEQIEEKLTQIQQETEEKFDEISQIIVNMNNEQNKENLRELLESQIENVHK